MENQGMQVYEITSKMVEGYPRLSYYKQVCEKIIMKRRDGFNPKFQSGFRVDFAELVEGNWMVTIVIENTTEYLTKFTYMAVEEILMVISRERVQPRLSLLEIITSLP